MRGAKGGQPAPLRTRFLAKVAICVDDDCMPWRGFIDKAGYGRIRIGGRRAPVGYAHRVSYELHVGAIPEGLELDHLCRNRACVSPAHLEAVTHAVNVRRGNAGGQNGGERAAYCRRGHDLEIHGYLRPDGRGRNCSECRRELRATA